MLVKKLCSLIILVPFSVSSHAVTDEEVFELGKKLIPKDTLFDAKGGEINGFVIESYRAKELDKDFKTTDKTYSNILVFSGKNKEKSANVIMVRDREAPNSVGVAIMPPGQALPVVNVGDNDGDGHFDYISYSVVDKNGINYLEIFDYEMDGQPDMRINLRDHIFELWYIDKWYVVNKENDKQYVVVDGKRKAVVTENNRATVK